MLPADVGEVDALAEVSIAFRALRLEELEPPDAAYVRIGSRSLRVYGGGEEGHPRVEPVIGEKRGKGGGKMFGIVLGEFRHRDEAGLVGLLVVALDAKV